MGKTQIFNHPLEFTCFSKVNNMCLEFYEYVDKLLLEFLPQRIFHRQSLQPWITPETSNLMKRLHTKKQLLKQKSTEQSYQMYAS